MAARLLEEVLDHSVRSTGEHPSWICGRLASLYRQLERYDDEVALLERHRDLHLGDDARSRFTARLAKARTLAHRQRPLDSGALRTVRESKRRLRDAQGPDEERAIPIARDAADSTETSFGADVVPRSCAATVHRHSPNIEAP
jgi:hypothetical protein